MDKMKVFYAHCKSIYNTPQEERDIAILQSLGFDVINPNSKYHDEQYALKGMAYSGELITQVDAVAFRSLPEGHISAGVAYEIETANRQGKVVIELPSYSHRHIMDVDETRQYLHEVGER